MSIWIRQGHRWLSVAFTATVVASFIVRAFAEPPLWLVYAPLGPLLVLLLSGLCLFGLPYFAGTRRAEARERTP
jgi:1,4-dihydroxy-2-naphthoate octaprenyltransferase